METAIGEAQSSGPWLLASLGRSALFSEPILLVLLSDLQTFLLAPIQENLFLFYLLIFREEKEWGEVGGEENEQGRALMIGLFHLLMHSLVASCMYPED